MLFISPKSILSSLLILHSLTLWAYPRGCEETKNFGFGQNVLILNATGDQAYFLIQNKSPNTIEFQRSDANEGFMTPPLQATLEASNWAAFASDVKNLNFKCYTRQNENTALVDCKDVLDICQYPRARFALSNMGNYWISSNKPQEAVIQDSVAKGIYLKW